MQLDSMDSIRIMLDTHFSGQIDESILYVRLGVFVNKATKFPDSIVKCRCAIVPGVTTNVRVMEQ
jgi:hypothetical protein